ncbi:Quinone oxido 2 [Cyphellophora attinorum]|uniref:Quinone oxido 2 n=1 Tax=Cyphellophora attinorum TaxID=1664694 RepID=A0A0N0NM80_9EURO|nr:Quinone oxido 2 [Phialophora attinorum]KPI39899.1 Quinone oxido 2 [Phialophora attinorum]
MLVIVGASGKLGFATLSALLDRQLISPEEIVCTTSSQRGEAKLSDARSKGVQVRKADWDDSVEHWTQTLEGCTKLFLISSARVQKDHGYEYPDAGREADHFKVLEAAVQAKVGHVYYTSLAFANPSLSRVMTAHERTERWLKASSLRWTIVREGLYNESWPLYLATTTWTSIPDLGLANAAVLAARSDVWAGKTFYLSQKQTKSLSEVAAIVSKHKGREVKVKIVDRPSHERYYIEERGMPDGGIWWWARTYDALAANECEIHDDTLETILKGFSVTPKSMEATMEDMLS